MLNPDLDSGWCGQNEPQHYRVWLRSRPGFYEQYNGKVDVYASTQEEAVSNAFRQLKLGAFPDRDRSMWKVERVEVIR